MRRMPDVLIFGDTVRSPEMRHEVSLMVPDPFLYAEVEGEGEPHVVVGSLEMPRLAELDRRCALHPLEEFGLDDLLAGGADRFEVIFEVAVRACRAFGVRAAVVPSEFPLELADRLRAAGVVVATDPGLFSARRRVKSAPEVAGIRRAQVAAEAGMAAAVQLLRAADRRADGLFLNGEALSCERVKDAISAAVASAGASIGDALIVSHGAQTAVGHELGFGPISAGEPVVIDLWPRDPASACFADMTRTFVVGEVPEAILRFHELTRDALERARAAVRPGIAAREVYTLACDPYQQAGLPTQLTKAPGEMLERGFFHSLGHGVGLQVHEPPLLGRSPDILRSGDVITLEPGCYEPGLGGCRLEDIVLVTDDGYETFTNFPYSLEP
jgi:Xaa-Pro aminopeptidase